MKIEQFDGGDERLAVTALCLDTPTLARVAGFIPNNAFASKWANIVVGWAISHYKQFKEAPGPATITSIYAEWAKSAPEDQSQLVAKFLGSLSPVQANDDYVVEVIERLVARNSMKTLADRVQAALSNGQIQAATDAIRGWSLPKLALDADYVEPLIDTSFLERVYDKGQNEILIRFTPGSALDQWFSPMLHRDGFVMLCGPDKSGKSSHLAGLAQRAVVQGKRVAWIDLGDMSEAQVMKRWSTAFVGKPAFACKYKIPRSIGYKEKEFSINYDEYQAQQGYTKEQAMTAWQSLASKGEPNRFRLVCRPAGTMTVEDLRSMLSGWAEQGWVPDIVAADYSALFAGSRGLQERHLQLEHVFKTLRMISQEFRCLLLTAAQTNSDAYNVNSYWLSKANFSGSKACWAYVTAAVGVNVTDTERRQQVCRFNPIVVREREYLSNLPSDYIAVAGCPSIGRFHLVSEFI